MRIGSKQKLFNTIKEAIDQYRGGLCFSEPNGRPILVNSAMNKLVFMLIGHTVINAHDTWKELSELKTDVPEMKDNGMVFMMEDGSVWQFRKQLLTQNSVLPDSPENFEKLRSSSNLDGVVQLEASDITRLYQISIELKENNLKLESMMKRQQEMLETIVRTNNEKELLSAKMKIHDNFGRCLVATKRIAGEANVSDKDYRRILDNWKEAVHGLRNIGIETENSTEGELNKVAELIGCRLTFKGDKPKDRRIQLMVYSAVREALTNAVRHGSATELITEYRYTDDGLKVMITNNGAQPSGKIKEGGGLSNLRKSIESSGALLDFEYIDGYALSVNFPKQERKA